MICAAEDVVKIEAAYLANPPSAAALLGHLHADRTPDALSRLASISAPTLITSGEMDWQIPTRSGSEVQNKIRSPFSPSTQSIA